MKFSEVDVNFMYITHVSSNLHESIYYSIPKQFTKLLQSISPCYSKSNQTEKLIHHSGLELFLKRETDRQHFYAVIGNSFF